MYALTEFETTRAVARRVMPRGGCYDGVRDNASGSSEGDTTGLLQLAQ